MVSRLQADLVKTLASRGDGGLIVSTDLCGRDTLRLEYGRASFHSYASLISSGSSKYGLVGLVGWREASQSGV